MRPFFETIHKDKHGIFSEKSYVGFLYRSERLGGPQKCRTNLLSSRQSSRKQGCPHLFEHLLSEPQRRMGLRATEMSMLQTEASKLRTAPYSPIVSEIVVDY